ncbi:MAG: RdgB/HAM1 family non-canonical purine NTP pyrophosphatase [Gammaproteobacteria bacterium]
MTQRIVLATGNAGKLREMQQLLAPLGFNIVAQRDLGVPDAEETGTTFVENAIIKARNATRHTGLPAIADDSGLEVDALQGEPGIYSARYAGPGAGDAENNARLLRELAARGEKDAAARFHCVLVFMRHAGDPVPLVAQGTWEGRIVDAPTGDGGFGYDPLFFCPDEGCTAAALPPERKNRVSHRAQALARLVAQLQENSRELKRE